MDRIVQFTNRYGMITIIILLMTMFVCMVLIRQMGMAFQKCPVEPKQPLNWIDKPHPSGKFGSSNPSERLQDVIDEFGPPDMIDKGSGGSAVWGAPTLDERGHCWERIEILDEQIPHSDPAPHTDFLYFWYKLDVPEDKINDVRALSESITYDPLKKVVSARCHFNGAVVATILLAKRIAMGELSLQDAKKMYGPLIFSTSKGHSKYNPKAYQTMVDELCE